jgi:hypothetical protein
MAKALDPKAAIVTIRVQGEKHYMNVQLLDEVHPETWGGVIAARLLGSFPQLRDSGESPLSLWGRRARYVETAALSDDQVSISYDGVEFRVVGAVDGDVVLDKKNYQSWGSVLLAEFDKRRLWISRILRPST